ncbi:MAG: UDP-N-acetylglucosamine 2-epimerase [Tissierellia bacterium]|nr:UDP-N-acetylglucosamine 2-epimerase [Tissierellia bacterium]MDD4781034.1 UDP-N-acetylglucosamine 2-epimerase [Tissierellia bacterium]
MNICIATGTRAEYGLLKPLIEKIKAESDFTLQLLVTGAHLSPEFGLTYKQIETDGYSIDTKVEMLLSSDTPEGITKSMGLGIIGYADAFKRLNPDLLVILGDRYEMLSVASTALIYRIPIAHIHGGELTEGAYDDAIRHAITKMSSLHFTSTEAYRKRVIQLGEQPDRVFNVGAIGLDNFRSLKLLSKSELEKDLSIKFCKFNYLVGFHPETLSNSSIEEQFNELLQAIDVQQDSLFIFTKANADTNGRIINHMIETYVENNPGNAVLFDSLGTLRYLSVMKGVTAVIGNSSSGILEAPSAPTATINIGDRQKGRIQAHSIINCKTDKGVIINAFNKVKGKEFRQLVDKVINPYGNGNASSQIMEVLKNTSLDKLRLKKFYDIEYD